MKSLLLLCACALLVGSLNTATAQMPRNFTVQGVITDSSSKPVADGIHTIEIKLYDKQTGGSPLHVEEFILPITKGLFNLTLGAEKPLSKSITFDKQYYVGISYDHKQEVTRIPLSSVPYALMTESVPDGSITTNKIADGSITTNKILTEV
ncbi:MAG: hypothetical protein HYZ54_04160 [Ignavibacteriae bacterium]|nr:hypothetical protein [Ignavibacteriota bacterium]